jgi:hypothetical protein
MNSVIKSVLPSIESCKEVVSSLAAACQRYIDEHDSYLDKTLADSFLIKKRLIERIERVFDEN